ncbi:glycerol-1-phosphate dehydrogenase [NAD(P)+] [Paracoccus isoporae]|uniref:Glycerol-1-phosphate dehydrogenase [NAD(P)+] n=1 Tax=Paracoccus isoporae TaxID=591205 RepID=A0A1G7H538_9RHOB|nr:iron-containing alcohol dehydrogenase [Paracoccus isoporae]SDE95384.1 glycerol-1-phosphate dehydrogenase [NAD(P)+] [Paracoccus isoporae]
MALDLKLSDLSRLDRIREVLAENDKNAQFTALGLTDLRIGDAVLDDLAEVVGKMLSEAGRPSGRDAKVRMIVDPVAIRRAGKPLKDIVLELLSGFDTTAVILDDGHPVLHADEPILAEAAERSIGADCIVSVGGGTITDVAKVACERANVPVQVVIQTAASVDGYTDNFAVVLQNGVKTTLPSRWPDAVLIDTVTVSEAPLILNASGFGELLSIYSAPGDWLLANELGLDNTFAPVLIDILALCGEGVEEWSAGISRAEPAATTRLAEALAMRGIVTGTGGTTASLSGMEHLFSHMLDMVAGEKGEPTGLHGAQVGVGSVIRMAAWEEFCARIDAEGLDVARLFPGVDAFEARVKDAFVDLDPTGRIGRECWTRYRTKMARWHASRDRIETAFADWQGLRDRHNALVLGSHEIAACLHRASAAKRFSDLDPVVGEDLMRWTVANCQFMRERGTIADLLVLAGWWDDAGVDRVVRRVEDACLAAERKEAA